jgi:hypothetical protein
MKKKKKKTRKMKPEKKEYSNPIEFLSSNRICKYSNTSTTPKKNLIKIGQDNDRSFHLSILDEILRQVIVDIWYWC